MKAPRVLVVGSGVSGLAAAHRLLELSKEKGFPLDLKVLESSEGAGGVLQTFAQDGFLMEGGPDCFITEKPAALQLCKRLGLENQLVKTNPGIRQSFILKNDRLHPIPEGFYLLAPSRLAPLLATPLLSPLGKLRAALEPFVKTRKDSGDESIGDFVRRRLGAEVLENLAQPLVGGVYNADPDELSLDACLPRFRQMELEKGSLLRALASRRVDSQPQVSGARYSLFVTFQGGMKTLAEALIAEIPKESLLVKTPVQALAYGKEGGWTVSSGDRNWEADHVILALQPAKMRLLLNPLDSEWDGLLRETPVHDSVTLNLGFRREDVGHPLDGFGFVVPAKEDPLLLGCTFASQKFPGRAPEGHVLLRAFLGEEAAMLYQREGEERILKGVLERLKRILRISGNPVVSRVTLYRSSMSYFRPGHLGRLARLEQKAGEYRGLYLAGNGLRGVGIPDCVAAGESAAEKICQSVLA